MEDFYNRYHKYVLNYFKARLGADNPEAEDLASEVMLKAWQSFPKFEGKSTVLHWIHRIAVNKYLDYYRRRKIVSFCSLDTGYTNNNKDGDKDNTQDWAEILLIDDSDPSDKLLKEETKKAVRSAISKLKSHHKEVIMMHYFQNMEVEDIANTLNVPSGTIKSRLFRARESLQKRLLPILQEKSIDD